METIGSNFVPQIPIIKEAGRLLPPFNFNLCPEFFNSSGFPNLTRRIACPPLESLRESALIGKIQQEGDFDQLDNQRYIDWRESSSKRQFDQIVKTERSDTTNLPAGGSILNSPINRDLRFASTG